ncbi:hypothetical protein B0H14DRAFT_2559524 [Mycena olivaceomarginata]|nr:hypothetical protein B0H14DRAFT_2559524 [Mycena olivaceomarginata]
MPATNMTTDSDQKQNLTLRLTDFFIHSGESLLSRAASQGNSRVELTIPLTLRRRASQFSLPAIHEFYPGFKRNWSIHADGTYTLSPLGALLRDPSLWDRKIKRNDRGMMGEKERVVVAHSLAGFEWLGVVCVGLILRPGEFNPVIEVMIKMVTNAGQESEILDTHFRLRWRGSHAFQNASPLNVGTGNSAKQKSVCSVFVLRQPWLQPCTVALKM